MKREPRTGDVVEVEWSDSERINLGWAPTKRYRKAAGHASTYRSAGYWLAGVPDRAVVALSADPFNGTVTEVMSIPVSAVTKISVLGRAHSRTRKALS